MSAAPYAGGPKKEWKFSLDKLSAVGDCKTKDDACEALKKGKKPVSADEAEKKFGMLKRHQKAIQKTCKKQSVTATFRQTNTACIPWIKRVGKGVWAKPHEILDKTISRGRLEKLNWGDKRIGELEDKGVMGLVGEWEGTKGKKLVGVRTIDGGSKKLTEIGSVADIPSNAVTGDYDMHDLIGPRGGRLNSGGPGERNFIRGANKTMGQDMIQHGPQANYLDYALEHEEDVVGKVTLPDPPVLVIDKNGEMYALNSKTDLYNFNRCNGTMVTKEWKEAIENAKRKGKGIKV